MKTLLLALISPGKSKGTREGAIRGLMGVGKEAIRKGLIEGGGAKVVGSECLPGEQSPVVDATMVSSAPFSHNELCSLNSKRRLPSGYSMHLRSDLFDLTPTHLRMMRKLWLI